MIQSIVMKKVASYNEARLENLKKINLIYGLNGSGKTILSNYLQDKENESFKECRIEGLNEEKILVYNQKFVETNFYQNDKLKGIFTLSETNAEAEKIIKEAQELKGKFSKEKDSLENGSDVNKSNNLKDLDTQKNQALVSLRDKLWEIKNSYAGGDRIFDYCLDGVKGSRDSLLKKIQSIQKSDKEPSENIKDLEKELSQIGENAQEIQQVAPINAENILNIENKDIFKQIIVGNENSIVSTMIQELGNFDWVKRGFNYMRNDERCPFCQQNTITEEFREELKKYFDKTFEERMQELGNLSNQYSTHMQNLPTKDSFLENIFIKEEKDKFQNLYNDFKHNLETNKNEIANKIKQPSQITTLTSSQESLKALNSFIKGIQNKINEHNQKIKNKQKIKDEIKEKFWQIMRWEYDKDVVEYEKNKENIDKNIKEIKNKISNLKNQIEEQDKIIIENQKNIINIEETINSINETLKDLGIIGFTIEKYEENFYRIVRSENKNPNFRSLSEGEKMIISFLYFLELCKGKEAESEEDKRKIIFIDDPISSLSHNHIFNVAQLIKKTFLIKKNNFEQVFVSTHNLYFFNEVDKLIEKDKDNNLKKETSKFRVKKDKNNTSCFCKMKKNEILNDYQAYWQILKDFDNEGGYVAIIPNVMRNILEHFFAFIGNNNYKDKINNKAFLRYIDRESHSDHTNLSDMKDIDIKEFMRVFEKIFKDSGYEEHYNIMMKNNSETT